MVKFDEDGEPLSPVLKASDIEDVEGQMDALEADLSVGSECLAPWGNRFYKATIVILSGDNTFLRLIIWHPASYGCHVLMDRSIMFATQMGLEM